MHKRKPESMQRDKSSKTLQAHRENKRGKETAGRKLLGSGRGPRRRKQRARQKSTHRERKSSRGLAEIS